MERLLNHSVQNIFAQVGQFDRYAIFEFYVGSEAYLKYGRTVYGFIIYNPSDRVKLSKEMHSDNIGDDDGLILLNGALQNENINDKLRTVGFLASDVQNLKAMDRRAMVNEYNNHSTKEIPNSINIEFNSQGFDLDRMNYLNLTNHLKSGIKMIPYEFQKYLTLKYLYEPENISQIEIDAYLIDPKTNFYFNDVALTLFGALFRDNPSNQQAKYFFNEALKNRRLERTKFICDHLGIANKHIEKLKANNNNAYLELMKVVLGFEPATIGIWDWEFPVYWDFQRFIHIYLRHCKDFFIGDSSKGQGTGFQYKLRDIRRVIKIVLTNNKDKIEDKLKEGKPFHLQGNKGYYYNGDYYSLKIENDGRLMQFHPQHKLA